MKTDELIAAFIAAIKAGQAEQVRALLAGDATLANAKDTDGTSAVLLATYYGKRDIQKMLLTANPQLSAYEAAAVGDEARLREWVRDQPDLLDAYSADGFTLLQLGSFFSRADVVKFLLARGANVNAVSRNPMRLMALHSSVAANHIPISKLLLANGAHVNAQQEGGFIPLHGAAQNGSVPMIQLLLEYGADPLIQAADGKTAYDFAVAGNHTEAALALQRISKLTEGDVEGTEVEAKDALVKTAAAATGWVQMLPGVQRRIVADGEKLMLVEVHLAAGSEVPRHAHVHEQTSTVHIGRLRFVFDDEVIELEPGQCAFMAANRPHKVVALADTVAFDAFSPPRTDFRGSELDPGIYGGAQASARQSK